MYSVYLMCLGCLTKKLLDHHTKGLLTISLLMYQISTSKNQTKGAILKDLMWDAIRLESRCNKTNAKHKREIHHKITWESNCFKHNLS